MPSKKRSTAIQQGRRVTRMKESVSSSTIFDEVDPLQSSTPKQETTLKAKLTKRQITEAAEQLAIEIQNKIDEYVTSATMFKLSLKSHLLKTPLWKFKEYRDTYTVDVIDITENVENAEPKREPRRLRNSSADRFKVPVAMKKPTGRVSRSVTRARNSTMKTPNMSQFAGMCDMTPITPKFNVNMPVSVLRHPRLGEQAVSLSGSPLHVTIPADNNPTVNVPLSDGKVMTIHPLIHLNQGSHHLPALDPECRDKLQSIQKYLQQMLNGHDSD
ncbi:hypothetical protein LSTR_LSTR001534 [Laodelphax striatellus]|uniref:Borealin C-terminal domain-containing protein n=1 Tax=Laodelphax striatellus TaxID=195883 RepID=A0A482XC62_LAOST|nr:hypothetical protein LSTR_LSTR001534 [Laodelphax striatellus]